MNNPEAWLNRDFWATLKTRFAIGAQRRDPTSFKMRLEAMGITNLDDFRRIPWRSSYAAFDLTGAAYVPMFAPLPNARVTVNLAFYSGLSGNSTLVVRSNSINYDVIYVSASGSPTYIPIFSAHILVDGSAGETMGVIGTSNAGDGARKFGFSGWIDLIG